MDRIFAIAIPLVGLLIVSTTGIVIGLTLPGNAISLSIWGLVLMVPYGLTSFGCEFAPWRLVRFLAILVCLIGLFQSGMLINEAVEMARAVKPRLPNFAIVLVMMVQATLSFAIAVCGVVGMEIYGD